MKEPVYTASTDHEGKNYVNGPGNGNSYYGGVGYPHMRLTNRRDAEAAAYIANEAYAQGFEAARATLRKALGL